MSAARLLLGLAGGGGSASFVPAPFSWQITSPSASSIDGNLASMIAGNSITVTVASVDKETGFRPASVYNALWTRDHAYTLWHHPTLLTASQRREFVTYTLSQRDGSDFIPDRIAADGTVTYLNPGTSALPFMDGIAMVVLALWADWDLTGDATTFTAQQSAIDACLAAIPRSVNGCVFSNPASPSVDYGFTDSVLKTGDVAYGTALQAWAYKMCDEMSSGGSSTAESDTYANLRAHAESGLATLRQGSGWYAASSANNSGVDDVWATALAVAEGLVSGADRTTSAQTIADAYSGGSISQFGLVRHLPVGQFWTNTTTAPGHYQNGGFWLTPLWDCVRAVQLVDGTLARTWATEAMQQLVDEHTAESTWSKVPYEWHNYTVGVGAMGYTASAAVVHRFI